MVTHLWESPARSMNTACVITEEAFVRIHSGESLIAWVDRCGHAVAGMLQGLSRKASRSAVKTGTSCTRAVAM
jgi:hypothetical protein